MKSGRLSSPLRTIVPSYNEHESTRSTSPVHSPALRSNITAVNTNGHHTANGTKTALARSREVSRERLDYTDLEGRFFNLICPIWYLFLVMAKIQLESRCDMSLRINHTSVFRLAASGTARSIIQTFWYVSFNLEACYSLDQFQWFPLSFSEKKENSNALYTCT